MVLSALSIIMSTCAPGNASLPQLLTAFPSSPLGMGLQYTLNRWKKLNVYTQEGFLPIDNNLVENSIIPIAIGRRNWLFGGSHQAAQRSAMLYTTAYLLPANYTTLNLYNG